MNKALIDTIISLAGTAQFASFRYTTKETKNKAGTVTKGGKTSRYTVILGARYDKLLEKSLLAAQLLTEVELMQAAAEHANDYLDELTVPVMLEARDAVVASLQKSIAAHANGEQSEDYTKAGQYEPIGNGLNINSKDNSLQLFCLVQSEVVINPGVYKHVNSAIETIAKKAITKCLPMEKFREFALDLGNIHSARLDGQTLIFGDEPGQVTVISREPKKMEIQRKELKDSISAELATLG